MYGHLYTAYCIYVGSSPSTSLGSTGAGLGSIPLFTPAARGTSSSSSLGDLVSALGAYGLPGFTADNINPSASSSSKGPLILSSALPPIPGKIMDKVADGQYVEFKQLLADNIALLRKLQEVGVASLHHTPATRMRDIQDPLSWVSCFFAFMAAKVDNQDCRDLAAYGMLVIHLARKHGGMGWLAYDSLFRQQQAAGAGHKWEELNPSLMAATVLGWQSEPGKVCSLCMASDHLTNECALQSFEYGQATVQLQQFGLLGPGQGRLQPAGVSYRNSRSRPYPPPPVANTTPEICKKFNRGMCSHNPCRYEHMCSGCNREGHCLLQCPTAKGKGTKAVPAPPSPAPGPK